MFKIYYWEWQVERVRPIFFWEKNFCTLKDSNRMIYISKFNSIR